MTNIDYSNTLMYEFENAEEFAIYCKVFKNEINNKQVVWTKGTDYKDLFMKGFTLNEQKQYKKAIKQLENALKFNPVGLAARFEMAESYICLKEFEKAKEIIIKTKNILISDDLIARFYRRLGFIFAEESKFDLSYSCYKQSLKYKLSDIANNEINYILSKHKININFDLEEELKNNEIPIIAKLGKITDNSSNAFEHEKTTEKKEKSNCKTANGIRKSKEENKSVKYVYCRKCGAKLTDDSSFCNKCATRIENVDQNTKQKCKKCDTCGKLLAEDSVYCQFCGSKDIHNANDENNGSNTKPKSYTKSYKIPLIISCFAVVAVLIYAIGLNSEIENYKEQISNKDREISSLKTKAKNAESNANRYQTKANQFSAVSNALANQQVKNSFRVDYYYLKNPTKKKVTIYTSNSYGGCTFSAQTTGGVSMTWGDTCYVGSKGCPIYVTNNGTSGTLTITNNYDSNKAVIYVEGN